MRFAMVYLLWMLRVEHQIFNRLNCPELNSFLDQSNAEPLYSKWSWAIWTKTRNKINDSRILWRQDFIFIYAININVKQILKLFIF